MDLSSLKRLPGCCAWLDEYPNTGEPCSPIHWNAKVRTLSSPTPDSEETGEAIPSGQRCEALLNAYAQHLCRPFRPFLDEMSL